MRLDEYTELSKKQWSEERWMLKLHEISPHFKKQNHISNRDLYLGIYLTLCALKKEADDPSAFFKFLEQAANQHHSFFAIHHLINHIRHAIETEQPQHLKHVTRSESNKVMATRNQLIKYIGLAKQREHATPGRILACWGYIGLITLNVKWHYLFQDDVSLMINSTFLVLNNLYQEAKSIESTSAVEIQNYCPDGLATLVSDHAHHYQNTDEWAKDIYKHYHTNYCSP